METLSILIVEDDLSFAIELDMLVRELGYKVLDRVDNSADALDTIMDDAPDMILMDIDIKGKLTGIEIAEKIIHLDIPILFITSYGQEDFYNRAKKTNFVGYLVKPIDKYSLKSSIEIAVESQIKQEEETAISITEGEYSKQLLPEETSFPLKEFLFFKKKGIYQKVKISNIQYLKSDDDYCLIQTSDGNFITSLNLSQMEEMLKSYSFMRIHRSYLVNLKEISSINANDNLVYFDDKQVPVSRSNRAALLEKMKLIK